MFVMFKLALNPPIHESANAWSPFKIVIYVILY